MERNPTANNFAYYKDPINYPANTSCGDILQLTYPFDDDLKERRYQLPAPQPPTTVSQQQQQQHQHQQQQQQQQQSANLQYHQSYLKPEQTYKPEKAQHANLYSNYNYPNYKDYQYTTAYYDQYKYNASLATNYPKSKDIGYHQNYAHGVYSDAKMTPAYCEEATISSKAAIVKAPNTPQISQYPVYPNCYGYPTGTTFPNQNYCSYAQNCTDDARLLWDDYQANRRLLSSYVSAAPASAPAPPIPQANCRIKSNYNGEFYGASASYPYHTEALRTREKLLYAMNSHSTPTTDNLYSSRSRCLPVDFKYQTMPQNMLPSYDRLNYVNEAQNYDYCAAQRQDANAYHLSPYGKPSAMVSHTQKHIRPTAMATDYCNPQSYYYYNEPSIGAELQDPYSQQYLKDSRHNVAYNAAMASSTRNISVSNDLMSKESIYNQQPLLGTAESYYAQNIQGSLAHNPYPEKLSKPSLTKGQNLREFLATWNEDEDDGIEKMEDDSQQVYLQQTNIEVENTPLENHLQFKGSFNTRPKIHVGITVDSNVASNQYINLPDIIIDIEKSKETDLITHTVDTTTPVATAASGSVGGASEKVVVLESVDVPVNDLNHYTNISLFDAAIDEMKDLTVFRLEKVRNRGGGGSDDLVTPTKEVLQQDDDESSEVPEEYTNNGRNMIEETVKSPKKWKRHNRLLKPKTSSSDRNSKCRMVGKIIKTKNGKLIRIRKVVEQVRKQRRSVVVAKKKTSINVVHSQDENNHSIFNPKTLKDLSICFFNSQIGRKFLMDGRIDEIVEESAVQDSTQLNQQKNQQPELKFEVPKLSALCEYALHNFYEQNNILLLNVDDLDSSLYFVGCDINENVVSTDSETGLNDSGFIELFIDDEPEEECDEEITDCTIDRAFDESGDLRPANCSNSNIINDSFDENGCSLDHPPIDPLMNDLSLTADENPLDFSALHHEEIVPDNLHAFESEKLLKYLQNKYIQKTNYLKILIIDKICKKYRKYILKRRKRQLKYEMTKKLLLSKFKDRLSKKT